MTAIFLNCGASRTQRLILRQLLDRGLSVRLYGREGSRHTMTSLGAQNVQCGSMLDVDAMAKAMAGNEQVIHLAPPLQSNETAMGQCAIDAARIAGVQRFIYISVIHPQIEYLLNHRAKLLVEDHLISSGLDFTILRPMHYFQNLNLNEAVESGTLALPYALDQRLGFVDMHDVAEAAAKVVAEVGHENAAYDLAGSDCLSGIDIADALSAISGRKITAVRIPLERITGMLAPALAANPGTVEWTAGATERLFTYYSRFGLRGNSGVLSWLLGRAPYTFADFVSRDLSRTYSECGSA